MHLFLLRKVSIFGVDGLLGGLLFQGGGVLTPFGFESSTLTIVLQKIIALKTMKSKFYVATSCATLISALGMDPIKVMKVPY